MAGFFLAGSINDEVAFNLQSSLWRAAEVEKVFTITIDCFGGNVNAALAIIKTMLGMPEALTVRTVCLSRAHSMATYILAAGTPGHRFVGSEAELMLHYILVENQSGNPGVLRKVADEMDQFQADLNKRYARLSGQKNEEDWKHLLGDYQNHYFSAGQAVEWGLADHVVDRVDFMRGEQPGG